MKTLIHRLTAATAIAGLSVWMLSAAQGGWFAAWSSGDETSAFAPKGMWRAALSDDMQRKLPSVVSQQYYTVLPLPAVTVELKADVCNDKPLLESIARAASVSLYRTRFILPAGSTCNLPLNTRPSPWRLV